MNRYEETKVETLSSKTTVGQKSLTKAQSRTPGPGSSVSMKSDRSKGIPIKFDLPDDDRSRTPGPGSSVSMKSDRSKGIPIKFHSLVDRSRTPGPGSSVSMKSDRSKGIPIKFDSPDDDRRTPGTGTSRISMRSDMSKGIPIKFSSSDVERMDQEISEIPSDQSAQQYETCLTSTFMLLEESIITFVKTELKRFQKVLSPDHQECLESQKDNGKVLDGEDEEQRRSSRDAFLKITLNFLKRLKQKELADCLQSKFPKMCQDQLKFNLKKKFQFVFEGIAKAGNPTPLNQIYTELYITEEGTGEVNNEHEVRQIERASRKPDRAETTIRHKDIFKGSAGGSRPIRTVVTKGVAGIGKTVLTQKFTLDWAEDKDNQDIQFTFPFTFRELNVLKEQKFSLVELVHHFFTESMDICRFEQFQVVFILDGLDECRLPLDFHNTKTLTDVTESTSVDVLLTNLIRGNLLPSARLWITTRPAAANQIPPGCVDMVTEVRGFTDPQKDEYFRKRFRDEQQATTIISHIKTSRSLHIMCHIPVFCWITATVLQDLLKTREVGELPKTLTDMYSLFLVFQTKVKNIKYNGGAEMDPLWSPDNKKMIESLGKLAFEQLQKGNLIFYESDLTECGINIRAASVYSGVFTQIFKEETALYQDKVFCFIHLSVQEFLAALYVYMTFINSGVNLLSQQQSTFQVPERRTDKSAKTQFYHDAVDKALESSNGHLDLFLRFLLGLSLQRNQTLLRGLLNEHDKKIKRQSGESIQETVWYIKKKIRQSLSAEKSINLFHCLNEVNDCSLVKDIQQFVQSGIFCPDNLSPEQWSALVFILLSSEDLDEFDLKKYSASEEVLLRLLPVVSASRSALLNSCHLTDRACEALASVLISQSSSLRELDLSNNDLKDSGMKLLCVGLKNPRCKLKSLRVSGCLITEEGFACLASALRSNPLHLTELDLTYNYSGDKGGRHWKTCMDIVRMEPTGNQYMVPGLNKYFCELTIDTNTVNSQLQLSENNRKVTFAETDQSYPDHPDRFTLPLLLCSNGLTGRCYWEVDWAGRVFVSVSYGRISRRGDMQDCMFGLNTQSWNLMLCSEGAYTAWHNNNGISASVSSLNFSSGSDRVAVYVDCPAGTLSFYRVDSDKHIHLHTFNTTFTELLYPGFGIPKNDGRSFLYLRNTKEYYV
ncbi:NLR family CARD domain-containing protein 3-like [Betta splendens]|uniref:NLR family CARD domain-containing protein 3-like n=1 Tax=Betta splendens TaxID=158456 RepID=A0A6P7L6T7_BETSP|nr:NLR family CARD domain-containing protein 3-like [Betta splendens]